MAKTDLENGDFVTPDYLDKINGTSASTGHKHDGFDVDGSAPKVDLVNHVDGVLPIQNFGEGVSAVFNVKFSADGGSTYPTTAAIGMSRIGTVIVLTFLQDLNVPSVTGVVIHVLPVTGNWPSNIFGTSTTLKSAMLVVAQQAPTADTYLAQGRYNGNTSSMWIGPWDSNFTGGGDVDISEGSSIIYGISPFEIV